MAVAAVAAVVAMVAARVDFLAPAPAPFGLRIESAARHRAEAEQCALVGRAWLPLHSGRAAPVPTAAAPVGSRQLELQAPGRSAARQMHRSHASQCRAVPPPSRCQESPRLQGRAGPCSAHATMKLPSGASRNGRAGHRTPIDLSRRERRMVASWTKPWLRARRPVCPSVEPYLPACKSVRGGLAVLHG